MKGKLIKAGVVALAIALFAACGGGDEPRKSTDAGTGTARTETKVAARTPAPMPTRPKRIDHLLLTPTALPEPTRKAEPEVRRASGEPAPSNGAERAATGGPMTIAKLVPEDPRTNDQVLLQDIYAQINMEQFALDPDQPIPWQGSRSDARPLRNLMPHQIIHQHPYLHLFPELEKMASHPRDIDYSPYSPFSSEYGYYGGGPNPYHDRFTDISGKRNGLIYFIYNPWFEPVFPGYDGRRTDTRGFGTPSSNYELEGAGPYWFGNNSVRGVLAETVAELLEEAKLPSTEPAQAPWFQKNHEGRTDLKTPEMQKFTMEEFISTTISYNDKLGWSCRGRRGNILGGTTCEIMKDLHITPQVEWEILHPKLPILKITAHARQTLPLAPAGVENPLQGLMQTQYSVSFVISLQNRWASFYDPNRWIIRFKDDLELYGQPWGLDPELPYPNYWDDTDYMQHRIIGPVVLTVHEYRSNLAIPVLKHGNYSRVPSITHWEAPGHILTDDQKRTIPRRYSMLVGKNRDGRAFQVWPNLRTPNAGFPLPGHVLTGPDQGPGTEAWKRYGMEGYDW